jgi:hypothetical protein
MIYPKEIHDRISGLNIINCNSAFKELMVLKQECTTFKQIILSSGDHTQKIYIHRYGDVLIGLKINFDDGPVNVTLMHGKTTIDTLDMTHSGTIPFDIFNHGGIPVIATIYVDIHFIVTGNINYMEQEYKHLNAQDRKLMAQTPNERRFNTSQGKTSLVYNIGSLYEYSVE